MKKGCQLWGVVHHGNEQYKMAGLGPSNDVVTTCKAVTARGGQRIIAVKNYVTSMDRKQGNKVTE